MRSYQDELRTVKHLASTTIGTTDTPSMDPRAFLKVLWGNPPKSDVLIWMRPQKVSSWYRNFDHLTEDLAAYPDRDLYTGVGYPAPGSTKLVSNKRCVEAHIGAITGMWADIDSAHPLHKKPNLPPTNEVALGQLTKFAFEPTIIISSGHGIQAWWLFDKPWVFEGEEDNPAAQKLAQWWNKEIRALYAEEGWTVDPVYDLTRVLRIPGTINHKDPKKPVSVTTIKENGPRYDRQQFLGKVPKDFQPVVKATRSRATKNVKGSGLVLSKDADPPGLKLMALNDIDPKFRSTWKGARPDMPDQSPSGYDMSLASMAAHAEWTDQEIVNLLIAWRRKHGHDLKLKPDYYTRTIAKAHESTRDRVEDVETPGSVESVDPVAPPAKSRRETDLKAVEKFIIERVEASTTIWWLERYWELRNGSWQTQDEKQVNKELRRAIQKGRGSKAPVVISPQVFNSFSTALKDELTPPCIDHNILPPEDRSMNYDLDTGTLINGGAFRNCVVTVDPELEPKLQVRPRGPREFFISTRPYELPDADPGRPRLFDDWIRGRIPDERTRLATWEYMGATITRQLHLLEMAVALEGDGRSGKGTMLKVMQMLMGKTSTRVISGGPASLAKSQFTLAGFENASLVLVPDAPDAPKQANSFFMEQYKSGAGLIKSMIGNDPVTIQYKNRDVFDAIVNAAFWIESNFPFRSFIQGDHDSFSWSERLIFIPMEESMLAVERKPEYWLRFKNEVSAIAWHAIDAYTAVLSRGGLFALSAEMGQLKTDFTKATLTDLNKFVESLVLDESARTPATDMRDASAAARNKPLTKSEITALYTKIMERMNIERYTYIKGAKYFPGIRPPSPPRRLGGT